MSNKSYADAIIILLKNILIIPDSTSNEMPKLEKRHALLRSTLDVAPVWLKKNVRIDALMFVEYLAQMVTALVERERRNEMKWDNISIVPITARGSNLP